MPQHTAPLMARIDTAVDTRAMLRHPFYTAWTAGELDFDVLGDYARQYFAFERAFPTYLSGIHTRIDDPSSRKAVLANLIDEEAGDTNHQELWLQFAETVGAERDSVVGADLLDTTQDLLDTFAAAVDAGPDTGLAALYAYESQASAVATSKLDGLARFYGISDGPGTTFFTTHESMDEWHAESERETITSLSRNDEDTLAAAESAAGALWGFLDGVQAAYC